MAKGKLQIKLVSNNRKVISFKIIKKESVSHKSKFKE